MRLNHPFGTPFSRRRTLAAHALQLGLLASFAVLTPVAQAASVLAAGDAAIVSFRSDTPDAFAFVLLKEVEAGTVIHFTDNGWQAAGSLRTTEGVVSWTAPAGANTLAGTVVRVSAAEGTPAATVGTAVRSGSFNLASGGDSLLAYQGTAAAPVFLFGINNTTAGIWDADGTNANTSALPSGLAAGSSALALPKKDNYAYGGALTSGTAAQLRAAIATAGNWGGDDTNVPDAPNAFTVTDGGAGPGPQPEPEPTPITLISAIQGAGAATGMTGPKRVQAIVTAWLPGLSGFYLQEEPTDSDGNDATSEGIFVYYGGTNPGVDANSVGQVVDLLGTVSEYRSQTQLTYQSGFAVQNGGARVALPPAVQLTLPISDMALWERYEGMRVEVASATAGGKLVVTDNYVLGRYGTATLAPDQRLLQYTETQTPSKTGNDAWLANLQKFQILLDDGISSQNPATVLGRNGAPLSASNTLRAGDATDKVEGILDQFVAGGEAAHEVTYRIQPTATPSFTGAARPTATDLASAVGAAAVKVSGVNVLNFFTTLGTSRFTTPTGTSQEGRGASNATEYQRQLDKTVATLIGMDADVYGLNEIQNNGYAGDSALQALVNALNAQAGAGVFDYVKGPFTTSSGGSIAAAGDDAITVALVYRASRVRPEGAPRVPDTATYDAFNGAVYGNRVPIAQQFSVAVDGGGREAFTVVVNHLKSKGSVLDPDTGDGQGANNQARLRAATQLAAWLATNPTAVVDSRHLLVGDFNSYSKEDPITHLEQNGFSKVSQGHSYSFDGLWGSLDHVLASNTLVRHVGNVVKWSINAEEPVVIDYNTEFKSATQIGSYYAADAYRSSDHNPIVLGLNFAPPAPDPRNTFSVAPPVGGAGFTGVFTGGGTGCHMADAPVALPPASVTPTVAPDGLMFPYGMLRFAATGCDTGGTATLVLTYPEPLPPQAQYWKWGRTQERREPHWFVLPSTVQGNTMTVSIQDGGLGDDDLEANGTITDPAGPAWPLAVGAGTVQPVPTLGEWARLLLAALLAGGAWVGMRRRRHG